jgi:branched-chain amino acid transport system ATP-binding protein
MTFREPVLEVKNVCKFFGGIKALDDVSLSLFDGELVGVIGPNGSGKTTLINVITGYIKPDKGSVICMGKDITGLPPHEAVSMGIVRTFQITRPFKELSVLSNVMLSVLFRERNVEKAREIALNILKWFNLEDKKDLMCKDLNIPDQKKIEFARALALDPKILLMDEVLAGLHIEDAKRILDIIRKLREERKITILIVEHRVKLLAEIVDRMIAMNAGRIIAEGSSSDVLNNPEVIKVYLGEGYK